MIRHRARFRRWALPARAASAALALLLQFALSLGSLAELRDARAVASEARHAGVVHHGTTVAPGRTTPRAHDETTCPACIARSLHAHFATQATLQFVTIEERTPLDLLTAVPPQVARTSSHLSRAPPIAG